MEVASIFRLSEVSGILGTGISLTALVFIDRSSRFKYSGLLPNTSAQPSLNNFLRPFLVFAYFSGFTLQLIDFLKVEGIPTLSRPENLSSLLTVATAVGLLCGSIALVAITTQGLELNSAVRKSLLGVGALAELLLITRLPGLTVLNKISPFERVVLLLVTAGVTICVYNRKKISRLTGSVVRFLSSKSPQAKLAGGAFLLSTVIGVASFNPIGENASTTSLPPKGNLNLQSQNRTSANSDFNFASGIIPLGSNGTDLPVVLRFAGRTLVGNPNLFQVVKIDLRGTLDKGRVGSISVSAKGVPQPNGFLNLSNSNAVIKLAANHQTGFGRLTDVSSDVIRGTVKFARNMRYDFILSTIASTSNRVGGELTLIERSPDPSRKTGVA